MAVDNAVLAELDAAGAECGFKMDFPGISANCEATSQTDGILITAVHCTELLLDKKSANIRYLPNQ